MMCRGLTIIFRLGSGPTPTIRGSSIKYQERACLLKSLISRMCSSAYIVYASKKYKWQIISRFSNSVALLSELNEIMETLIFIELIKDVLNTNMLALCSPPPLFLFPFLLAKPTYQMIKLIIMYSQVKNWKCNKKCGDAFCWVYYKFLLSSIH